MVVVKKTIIIKIKTIDFSWLWHEIHNYFDQFHNFPCPRKKSFLFPDVRNHNTVPLFPFLAAIVYHNELLHKNLQ